jgi:hypothetical protein
MENFLKGVWHEIFDFRFFSWISSARAPEYSIPWGSFRIFTKIRGDIQKQSVNVTGDNLSPVTTTPAVMYRRYRSLTLARIFVKIWNGPNRILGGQGKLICEKTWSRKSRVRLPLLIQKISLLVKIYVFLHYLRQFQWIRRT